MENYAKKLLIVPADPLLQFCCRQWPVCKVCLLHNQVLEQWEWGAENRVFPQHRASNFPHAVWIFLELVKSLNIHYQSAIILSKKLKLVEWFHELTELKELLPSLIASIYSLHAFLLQRNSLQIWRTAGNGVLLHTSLLSRVKCSDVVSSLFSLEVIDKSGDMSLEFISILVFQIFKVVAGGQILCAWFIDRS